VCSVVPDVVEDELMQGVHVPLGIHERLELTQVVTQRRPNDVRHPPRPQSHTESQRGQRPALEAREDTQDKPEVRAYGGYI
jgi:hypothetical protein